MITEDESKMKSKVNPESNPEENPKEKMRIFRRPGAKKGSSKKKNASGKSPRKNRTAAEQREQELSKAPGEPEDRCLSLVLLIDYYGEVLNERKRKIMKLYYEQDFSLREIAEEMKVTPQGIYGSITHSVKTLMDLEAKLGGLKRDLEQKRLIAEIEQKIPFGHGHAELLKLVRKLKRI